MSGIEGLRLWSIKPISRIFRSPFSPPWPALALVTESAVPARASREALSFSHLLAASVLSGGQASDAQQFI